MEGKRRAVKDTKARTTARTSARSLRVLVVEDHLDTRNGLELFLGMLGYELRFAVDVASALAAASEEEFDVLLSDIGLPDGNGWELLRELDKRGRRPAVAIAMSGFNTDRDLACSRDAGFAMHLVKPFQPEKLEAALEQAGKQ